uniref:Tetraspanin n=1 Tax=Timema cristinae TaxID=61476 RepID=A0A7R9CUD4_TIMCR|nr:unnamed protein product [Timema cristinae]
MVSGGMSCVKYLLFVFNLVFVTVNISRQISGLALLVIGAIIQDVYSDYTDFLHGKFFAGPILLIVVGIIVFVVAFFGCCGAVKENHCMIITSYFSYFLTPKICYEVCLMYCNKSPTLVSCFGHQPHRWTLFVPNHPSRPITLLHTVSSTAVSCFQ